jgi:hypothetical protein
LTVSNATALAAKICEARDGGASDADIIRDNADELGALLAAPAFLVIATTVLPLVLSIAKEMRGGKKLLEVLSGRATEIIEAVLAVVPLFAPKKSDTPNVAPIVPK